MTNKNLQCACKKYESNSWIYTEIALHQLELPYIETFESGATRIKRYKAIKHDVNKCKAITGDE